MADDDTDEEAEPAVELGEGDPVEGAPLARVASRLDWPSEQSDIENREGDAVVRTPDGPRELSELLAEADAVYFESRRAFTRALDEAIGDGPVPTAEE